MTSPPSLSARAATLCASFCTFDRLIATGIFLAIIVACALTPMQTDTWWQLRAGRDMLASRHVLLTDTYSYTARGAFWPNHEWLAEIFYYVCYRIGGLELVTLAAAAMIAAAWAVSWRLCTGSVRLRALLIAPSLIPASMHWEPRPHAFSFLFLSLTMLLIVGRRYWWLPLTFFVWANCHGGVVTGFVVLAVGLAVSGAGARRRWLPEAATFVGCAIAATLTPLGPAFWTEIPKSLARIRLYPLDEWRPPSVTDWHLAPFWLLAAGLCAAIVACGRRKPTDHEDPTRTWTLVACALVLLPLAITAVRNVGLFLLIAIPAVTALVQRVAPEPRRRRQRPAVNAVLMSSAAAVVAIVIACAYTWRVPRLRWTPLPAASLTALSTCRGNLYNRYDEGGYLIWFAPERPVFLDGRQDPYDPALVLEQIRVEASGDSDALFARYRVQCAYLPAASPVAARLQRSWKTLYRDHDWIVLADPKAVARSD